MVTELWTEKTRVKLAEPGLAGQLAFTSLQSIDSVQNRDTIHSSRCWGKVILQKMTAQALSHHLSRLARHFPCSSPFSSPLFLSPSAPGFTEPHRVVFRRTLRQTRAFFSYNSSRVFSVFASGSGGMGVISLFASLFLLGIFSNSFWEFCEWKVRLWFLAGECG